MTVLALQKKSGFHRIFEGNDREGGRPLAWQKVLCPKKQAMVESMVPACWQLAHLYTPQGYKNNPDNIDESYFQALTAVMRSAHSFDDGLGFKFSSYAYGSAQRQVWTYWKIRRESVKGNIHHLNFHDLTGNYSDPIDFMFEDEKASRPSEISDAKLDSRTLMSVYEKLKLVNHRWSMVVAMRLGLDGYDVHNLADCSREFGCTRQFASQIYYKAINWIKKAYDQEKKAEEIFRKTGSEDPEEFHRRNRITWRRMVQALPELQEVETEGLVLEVFDGQ